MTQSHRLSRNQRARWPGRTVVEAVAPAPFWAVRRRGHRGRHFVREEGWAWALLGMGHLRSRCTHSLAQMPQNLRGVPTARPQDAIGSAQSSQISWLNQPVWFLEGNLWNALHRIEHVPAEHRNGGLKPMTYRERSNERELFDLRTSSDRTKGQVQRSPSDDLFSQLTVAGLSIKTLPTTAKATQARQEQKSNREVKHRQSFPCPQWSPAVPVRWGPLRNTRSGVAFAPIQLKRLKVPNIPNSNVQ